MHALSHLSPETRAVAELNDDQRFAHLAEDHWIDYPRAREALQQLERLLRCPERTRMPGLLLHGESNIGKSMIIQKFLRAHPAREGKLPRYAAGWIRRKSSSVAIGALRKSTCAASPDTLIRDNMRRMPSGESADVGLTGGCTQPPTGSIRA